MGKMISPAGEVDIQLKTVKRRGAQVVIVGAMGVWDAEICLSAGEALRMLLNRNVPLMIITLPIALLMRLFKRKRNIVVAGNV